MTTVTVDDFVVNDSSLVRWRTAFWSAVVTTPLVAGVLGAFVGRLQDGQSYRAGEVGAVIAAIVIANVLAWRWPRASGIALGGTALVFVVGLFWGVGLGVAAVAE